MTEDWSLELICQSRFYLELRIVRDSLKRGSCKIDMRQMIVFD